MTCAHGLGHTICYENPFILVDIALFVTGWVLFNWFVSVLAPTFRVRPRYKGRCQECEARFLTDHPGQAANAVCTYCDSPDIRYWQRTRGWSPRDWIPTWTEVTRKDLAGRDYVQGETGRSKATVWAKTLTGSGDQDHE